MRKRKTPLGRKLAFWLILAVTICTVLLAFLGLKIGNKQYVESAYDIRTGIDIRGGVNAVFEPEDDKVKPTDEQLEAAREIFELRLDSKNILDRNITVDNNNKSIIVEFPWQKGETKFDPQAAIKELGATAELTFCSLKKDESGQAILDNPQPDQVLLSGKHIQKAEAGYQEGKSIVALTFSDEGKKLFEDATTKYINDYIGIFLDDLCISAPQVNSTITDGQAVIEGSFTAEEATDLANKINAGALPYTMSSTNYSSITATMGDKALDVMLNAGGIALIIIALFMLIMYRLPGVVACINLAMQLAIQLLLFANLGLTITLPGIAGIILSIGMSVDANVIISERIREEMRKGKSLIGSIDTGYGRAFTAILDCNLTTAIVALLLIIFGSGSVLSFGYTLLIGIVLNFLVSTLASKWMIRSLATYKFCSNPKFYGYKEVEEND